MELKIGVLLPRSDMFPTLAMDFLNGLKLSLKNYGSHINSKFLVESTGTAADENLLKTAEKMILQEDIDLAISFCSIHILEEFENIFTANKRPLIHIDLGGSVIKKAHNSPYVLHHTLNIWQSAYAAGKYAAKHLGKKAFIAASIYDGGYQISESLLRGLEEEGGIIVGQYVGPMDYKSETFDAMFSKIEEVQPEVIFCVFSHKEGVKIFNKLAKSNLNGTIPFMAIPLMTDETSNTENYKIENVHSIASWAFDDENPQMQDFIKSYVDAHEEKPTIISLMGYEVGLTLALCVSSEGKITKKLTEAVQNKNISTPRGILKYNGSNESQVESFKLRKFQFNKTSYHNIVIETLDASFSENLYEVYEERAYTGWKNPYICT